MDDEGLDPDALERELAAASTSFLYTIPTFQNPSGRTLSTERRRRVVELAQAHGVPVLEDDPYGLVRYEGEAPPSLLRRSEAASSSPTPPPSRRPSRRALRVGWFVAPAELAARIEARAVSTYISPPFLTQATVHELIDARRVRAEPRADPRPAEGAPRRDARCARARARRRRRDVERAGGRLLPLGRPTRRRGRAAHASRGRRCHLRQGRRTSSRTAAASSPARLAFSYASPSEIDSGVSTLACAPARLTASVQLREQHAADEPCEQREQDHPDQRRPRLAEDEVDGRLLVVADDERDQVARDQDEQAERDPEPRLPAAVELVAGDSLGDSMVGELYAAAKLGACVGSGTRRGCRGGPRAPSGEADASGTACRRAGRTTPPAGSSSLEQLASIGLFMSPLLVSPPLRTWPLWRSVVERGKPPFAENGAISGSFSLSSKTSC